MRYRLAAAAIALALGSSSLQAQYAPAGTFGSLPANSFGGTGIPTNAVMLGGFNGVVLGLSATNRFDNAPVTNNGAGTYYATPGFDTHAPTTYAQWNFDLYIGGANANSYFYAIMIDNNAATGNALTSLTLPANFADSWNIGMGFIGGNPAASGEYNYALVQYEDAAHTVELAHVAIDVDVSTTPEPASLVLLGTGLAGIGAVVRRRRRA